MFHLSWTDKCGKKLSLRLRRYILNAIHNFRHFLYTIAEKRRKKHTILTTALPLQDVDMQSVNKYRCYKTKLIFYIEKNNK